MVLDTSKWPLLLKNYDKLSIRARNCTHIAAGHSPLQRPLNEYIANGCINLDKPANFSPREVVAWIKSVLCVKNIGHSENLDSVTNKHVMGNLILCFGKAKRLVTTQRVGSKEYICIVRFHKTIAGGASQISKTLENLTGMLFQKSLTISKTKHHLRIHIIYKNKLIEYDNHRHVAVFWVSCDAGTCIKSFCSHVGLFLGVESHILELRRVRSGILTEKDNMVTMQNVLDAVWLFNTTKNESYLRRLIMPIEVLLTNFKRLVVKDSAVNAVCYGAALMIPGLLRFENTINLNDEVVIMTTKGEAIAIGLANMNTAMLFSYDNGSVAKIKIVIMERDAYPKRWGESQ